MDSDAEFFVYIVGLLLNLVRPRKQSESRTCHQRLKDLPTLASVLGHTPTKL